MIIRVILFDFSGTVHLVLMRRRREPHPVCVAGHSHLKPECVERVRPDGEDGENGGHLTCFLVFWFPCAATRK